MLCPVLGRTSAIAILMVKVGVYVLGDLGVSMKERGRKFVRNQPKGPQSDTGNLC